MGGLWIAYRKDGKFKTPKPPSPVIVHIAAVVNLILQYKFYDVPLTVIVIILYYWGKNGEINETEMWYLMCDRHYQSKA
jgi:hypothetical protein